MSKCTVTSWHFVHTFYIETKREGRGGEGEEGGEGREEEGKQWMVG